MLGDCALPSHASKRAHVQAKLQMSHLWIRKSNCIGKGWAGVCVCVLYRRGMPTWCVTWSSVGFLLAPAESSKAQLGAGSGRSGEQGTHPFFQGCHSMQIFHEVSPFTRSLISKFGSPRFCLCFSGGRNITVIGTGFDIIQNFFVEVMFQSSGDCLTRRRRRQIEQQQKVMFEIYFHSSKEILPLLADQCLKTYY